MKVLIVEDEASAREFLVRQIQNVSSSMEIVAMVDSVKSAVEWFANNPHPDIAFFDIQLSDGLSFEIFEKVEVLCPVIFTTAYEEYAIKAFKVNSIDYLLKPIDVKELTKAIDKFYNLKGQTQNVQPDLTSRMLKMMDELTTSHKERFLVSIGSRLQVVSTTDIAYFYSMEKSTFLAHSNGKSYALDYSLDKLEQLVNPKDFFRIDRRFLVNRSFINEIITYSSSRFKLKMVNFPIDDMIVSRKRAADFKRWLEG